VKQLSKALIISFCFSLCLWVVTACTHPVRRLVFQPHKIGSIPPFPEDNSSFQRFWMKTEQGKVEWWLFKGNDINASEKGPAVLMAHGNRELIDFYRNRAEAYQGMGYTVLLGEYRGYGRSAGKPSRKHIASDFRYYYDQLSTLSIVDSKRIVFHGRSLGGAVLSELALQRPPAAIIVESTFTSIKEMAHGAPSFLISDRYDTLSALMTFKGPILIIHGNEDKVVPVEHALRIKKNIPIAQLVLYDCGHSDGPPDWDVYWQDITDFLDEALFLERSSRSTVGSKE
jgi:pimeloyl-ACP methyl ester carboxylesterase